jgi:hypothetical protein
MRRIFKVFLLRVYVHSARGVLTGIRALGTYCT